MSRVIRFGRSTDVKSIPAAASFAWPVNAASAQFLDLTGWTKSGGRAPDVIVRLKADGACQLQSANGSPMVGLVGLAPDGGMSLVETPLFGGGAIQFYDANIGREFAVAVGGYNGLWLVAFDGSLLSPTNAKNVIFSAFPADSAEA